MDVNHFGVPHRSPYGAPDSRRQSDRCNRCVPPHPHDRADPDCTGKMSGRDEGGVVSPAAKAVDELDGELLDSAGSAEVVRADDRDPHVVSWSLGQLGWSRCHCSGAARMSFSSSLASRCVVSLMRVALSPESGNSIGGRTTT